MSTFAGENSYELTGYGVPFTADTAGGTPDAAGGHGFASVEPKDTNDPRIDLLKDMAIKQAQRIDLQACALRWQSSRARASRKEACSRRAALGSARRRFSASGGPAPPFSVRFTSPPPLSRVGSGEGS